MTTKHWKRTKLACASATAAVLAVGCGNGGTSQEQSAATYADPLYAMMIQVYDPEDRTVYVSLSKTLDIGSTHLDEAREFASVANFAEIDGKILVSSGSGPTITEFDVSDDFAWREGRTVSFAEYPLLDNANFYYQFVVDPSHALLPYEGTSRILWNPSEMLIENTLEDTSLPEAEPGLTREAGGNRNAVHYDASVMQAIFYHDDDWYDYGKRSHIIVYEEDSFAEKSVLDVPCPGLSLATRDEQENTYFSTWDVPATSLTGEAPATCVAKVDARGEPVDTLDLREWTGGRVVNNFRYVGSGKAFANVLHHEVFGVDSPAELDAETLDALWMSGPFWKLWLFDMDAGTAAPVEGIDVDVGSGAQFAVLDGRTFVFVPYDDWARSKAYELHDDGTATEHFDTVGDVFKWVRVR